MAGVEVETFSLTWKVENVHLCNRKMDTYLHTQTFQVGILQNTMWQLLFAPEGITDPLYMGCSLLRVSTVEEPEIVKVRWKLCLLAEGGAVRFETGGESLFRKNIMQNVPAFIRKSELLPSDTPQNSLTIYCEMKNDPLYSSDVDSQYDFEALSSDLNGLLESGFRSDFKMYCRGKIFNVHKFILLTRWPSISASLETDITARDDIIMTGVEPSTLYSFLTFLYSGKLPRKDITMELCTYMHENCCDNLFESFETPISSMEFVTHIHHEWKHLTWEIGDENAWVDFSKDFFRVIPLEEVYGSELVIVFGFEERYEEDWLRLDMFITGVMLDRPILIDGEISFINKNTVVCSCKVHHLIESSEQFRLPPLMKKSDLYPNTSESKCVEMNLCLCDGNIETRLALTNIQNASRFYEVKDLRKLSMDLSKSNCAKDLKLKIGEHIYNVHSTVIAARSEKFREMIEENDEMIEIDGYFNKKAANSLIRYLYGERLLLLDLTSKFQLANLATKYSLPSLAEKIGRALLESQFLQPME